MEKGTKVKFTYFDGKQAGEVYGVVDHVDDFKVHIVTDAGETYAVNEDCVEVMN